MRAAGLHVADMRGLLADGVEGLKVEGDSRLPGDSHQVKHCVRRPAECHIHPDGVCETCFGDEIPRADPLPDEANHPLPALPGYAEFCGGDRRDSCTTGEGEPQRLGHAGHRVCGIEPLAAPAPWHRRTLELPEFLLAHGTRRDAAHALKNVDQREFAARRITREHRAAGDDDRRDVAPYRRHEHAGDDLVAGADADQAVKPVRLDHQFDRVSDVLP